MRLHVGNGTVYLRDWINIDVPGPKTFLAFERPDLVEKWITDESAYYAKHWDKNVDTVRQGPRDDESVCDIYGRFTDLLFRDGSVEEVLSRHCFEHLSITEARAALHCLHRIIRPGGILRLDVPDHEETLRLFRETGDQFYVRHLLGPRRNDYGYHVMSYDRVRLISLVQEYGFKFREQEENLHFYPAIALRFYKPKGYQQSVEELSKMKLVCRD